MPLLYLSFYKGARRYGGKKQARNPVHCRIAGLFLRAERLFLRVMRKHIFHAPADMAAHGLFRRFRLPVPDSFQ